MNMTKGMNRKSAAVLAYIILSVVLLSALSFISPAQTPEPNDFRYMNRDDLFRVVKDNAAVILEDVRKNDFTRTRDLLASGEHPMQVYGENKASIVSEDGCVSFFTFMTGGPGSRYEGFYYTPWDGPAPVCGTAWPWIPSAVSKVQKYDIAELEPQNLQSGLKQENNEWVWYEKDFNPGGDNEYHTQKICDFLWYFKLVY